ncbi:hypothetical protein RchiOBHm_Chr2g0104061 [Rosa chinensis]|uniref:Reticulon-like protein n=1 Tax=Rosa chinensis TaxID=74649 RepID=A0A2P6RN53_ROSCH|nr:hypothetical protein RchiOBHm_Chr2g0104061 [Rosa chinensis]
MSETDQTYQSPLPSSDTVSDIFLWKKKKQSVLVLSIATAIWVLLKVYRFNFLTVISWAAMFIVTSLFVWGNMLRFFNKEPPNLYGMLEVTEETALGTANTIRAWIEEGIRWMFRVAAEREWFVFAGTATAARLWVGGWVVGSGCSRINLDLLPRFMEVLRRWCSDGSWGSSGALFRHHPCVLGCGCTDLDAMVLIPEGTWRGCGEGFQRDAVLMRDDGLVALALLVVGGSVGCAWPWLGVVVFGLSLILGPLCDVYVFVVRVLGLVCWRCFLAINVTMNHPYTWSGCFGHGVRTSENSSSFMFLVRRGYGHDYSCDICEVQGKSQEE